MNKHSYSVKLTMQARSCRQRLSNMSTVRLQLRSQVLSLGTRLLTTTTYLKRRWPSSDRSYNLEQNKIEKQTPLPSPEIKFEATRRPIFSPILNLGQGSGG